MQRKEGRRPAAGGLFGVLARLGVLAFCGYLLVCLVSNQVEIMVKNQQVATLEQQVAQQQAASREMERLLGSSDDITEYYEKIAREKLGYTYPDEQIFVDISGQ